MGISVTTTQNVNIDYDIANIGDRILAAFFDYLIIAGFYTATGFLFYYLSKKGFKFESVYYFIIYMMPVFLYDLICELSMNGQSFGKRLRRIKVIKLDGSQPSAGDYFLRWIFRPIDVSTFFGVAAILTMAINGKGQRIGDIAAGTTVVRIKKAVSLSDTIFAQIEDNYKPGFPEAENLESSAVEIIKEVLNSKKTVKNKKTRAALAEKAKISIEKKLGISSSLEPIDFLEIILKDYNYYTDK